MKIKKDTIIKRPENYINPEEVRYNKYLYQNRIVSEKEVYSLLTNTNDEKIIHLVQQSKKAKADQRLGFAAIPCGLGALISVTAFSYNSVAIYNSHSYAQTHQITKSDQDNLNGMLIAAAIFASAGLYISIQSGINGSRELRLNTKAIKLYNQKF